MILAFRNYDIQTTTDSYHTMALRRPSGQTKIWQVTSQKMASTRGGPLGCYSGCLFATKVLAVLTPSSQRNITTGINRFSKLCDDCHRGSSELIKTMLMMYYLFMCSVIFCSARENGWYKKRPLLGRYVYPMKL